MRRRRCARPSASGRTDTRPSRLACTVRRGASAPRLQRRPEPSDTSNRTTDQPSTIGRYGRRRSVVVVGGKQARLRELPPLAPRTATWARPSGVVTGNWIYTCRSRCLQVDWRQEPYALPFRSMQPTARGGAGSHHADEQPATPRLGTLSRFRHRRAHHLAGLVQKRRPLEAIR
jgi:hypothetical protein